MAHREVTKTELAAFLATYPRRLLMHVTRICAPPYLNYYDPTLGKYPEFCVAGVMLESSMDPKLTDRYFLE